LNDNGNMRKCTIKIKLLRDSFQNHFCNFAKEEDCILVFTNPFSVNERKIMKMPSTVKYKWNFLTSNQI